MWSWIKINRMKGIHINWTKPYLLNKNTTEFKQEQYKVLVQLLSVLYWKKFYGEIILYTDNVGLRYYENCGYPLIDLYDYVDVTTLQGSLDINPLTFWAGGKLFAVNNEPAPFVMLDLDLFITDDISNEFEGQDLVFSHYETLQIPIYPNPKDMMGNDTYKIRDYNWSQLPGNVCMTYFGSEEFRKRYSSEAIQFMRSHDVNETTHAKNTDRMVFAEQRLLTTIAENMGIKYKPIIKDIYNSNNFHIKYNGNQIDTGEEPHWFVAGESNINDIPLHHTWGYKQLLVNKGLKLLYVEQMQNLIKKDFPEYTKYLKDPRDE
jgi:hypothetical protein